MPPAEFCIRSVSGAPSLRWSNAFSDISDRVAHRSQFLKSSAGNSSLELLSRAFFCSVRPAGGSVQVDSQPFLDREVFLIELQMLGDTATTRAGAIWTLRSILVGASVRADASIGQIPPRPDAAFGQIGSERLRQAAGSSASRQSPAGWPPCLRPPAWLPQPGRETRGDAPRARWCAR